jgi:hypothetical protein
LDTVPPNPARTSDAATTARFCRLRWTAQEQRPVPRPRTKMAMQLLKSLRGTRGQLVQVRVARCTFLTVPL